MVLCFFKQKTAYEMRISDWSSDVCSSDLRPAQARKGRLHLAHQGVHRPGQEIGAEQNILRAVERVEPAADPLDIIIDVARRMAEIGRASCRERVSQYV